MEEFRGLSLNSKYQELVNFYNDSMNWYRIKTKETRRQRKRKLGDTASLFHSILLIETHTSKIEEIKMTIGK